MLMNLGLSCLGIHTDDGVTELCCWVERSPMEVSLSELNLFGLARRSRRTALVY